MDDDRVVRASSPNVVQKLRAEASSISIDEFSGILETDLGSADVRRPGSQRGADADDTESESIPGFTETLEKIELDRQACAASRRSAKTRGTTLFTD